MQDLRHAAWTTVGEPALDSAGLADWVNVPLGPNARWTALRISDPAGNAACVQLNEVLDPNAAAWVTPPASLDDYRAYCRSCPERVSVGVGAGFYVLPSGDPPPPAASSLDVQAAARDCTTFLSAMPGPESPTHLRIEALSLPEIDDPRQGTVLLEIAITEGSSLYEDSAPLPTTLMAALAEVNRLFAPGRLRIRPVRVRRLQGEDSLALERGDHTALEKLYQEMHACDHPQGTSPDESWVPLVLAGCIELSDPVQMTKSEPDGFVPRIPDGMPAPGRAHGVFIKGRTCNSGGDRIAWPAAGLGKLIAHELGHYLGLYHSIEEDGTIDKLDDTDADNLMNFRPQSVSAPSFSQSQFRIMRRHPAIWWE